MFSNQCTVKDYKILKNNHFRDKFVLQTKILVENGNNTVVHLILTGCNLHIS